MQMRAIAASTQFVQKATLLQAYWEESTAEKLIKMAQGPVCDVKENKLTPASSPELCDDETLYLFSNFIVKSDGCF